MMRTGWIVALTGMVMCGGAFGQGEPPAMDVDGNAPLDFQPKLAANRAGD